jgi:hypothetical protein
MVKAQLTDNIFVIRNILKKCYEYNLTLHQLFIDFTQSYDSVKQKAVFDLIRECGIPKKLQNLVMMTLQKMKGKVKVQGELSEEFVINRGLRQDVLSADMFILILEKVVRKIEVNKGGMIFNRTVQ